MKIAELKENLSGLEGTYIVSDIHNDIAKNGSPYVRGKLSDITGSVNFTFFDGDYGLNPHMNGTIVHVESFATQIFNGKLQAYGRKTERPAVTPVTDADEELKAQLVKTSPGNPERDRAYLEKEISLIEDADYRALVGDIWNRSRERFISIPAALSHHHSGIHGLLRHTVEMLFMAETLLKLYPGLDAGLLRTGVILHDIGKLAELECSDLGLVSDYTEAGNMAGHLILGAQEVQRTAEKLNVPVEKSLLLQNMILSHHGKPEFGMAAKPASLEAVVLFYLDYAGSHITEYSDLLKDTAPGEYAYVAELPARLKNHQNIGHGETHSQE